MVSGRGVCGGQEFKTAPVMAASILLLAATEQPCSSQALLAWELSRGKQQIPQAFSHSRSLLEEHCTCRKDHSVPIGIPKLISPISELTVALVAYSRRDVATTCTSQVPRKQNRVLAPSAALAALLAEKTSTSQHCQTEAQRQML